MEIEVVTRPVRRYTPRSRILKHTVGKSTKKPAKKPLRAIKPKARKKDLWHEFGLEMPQYIRYSGLGGILWHLTSRYVRMEEFKKYGGHCVDGCGRYVERYEDADCGHFRSAKSLSTRFLRENLGLQHKYCNSPHGGNGNQYAFGKIIDQRYGAGTADRLTELAAQTSTPFSKEWYRTEIRRIKELIDAE